MIVCEQYTEIKSSSASQRCGYLHGESGKKIKLFYDRMTHVLCVSHLLHNAAMRVKTHYTKVDALVANIKAVTVKNKTRTELFKAEGLKLLPQPVVTIYIY